MYSTSRSGIDKWLAHSVASLFLVTVSFGAQDAERDAEVVLAEARLGPMLSDWERQHATTVDPRLLRELAGEFVHFTIIYAYPGNAPELVKRVTAASDDDTWLREITRAHLDGLSTSTPTVQSYFARLAEGVGETAEAAGWRTIVVNAYVLNDLSEALPDVPLGLSADGLPIESFRRHRMFLVGPGEHVIHTQDGRSWQFSVAAPALPATEPTIPQSGPRSGRGH